MNEDTVGTLHRIAELASQLRDSGVPQVDVAGLRVESLVRSLLDSVVVDEKFLTGR